MIRQNVARASGRRGWRELACTSQARKAFEHAFRTQLSLRDLRSSGLVGGRTGARNAPVGDEP